MSRKSDRVKEAHSIARSKTRTFEDTFQEANKVLKKMLFIFGNS